MLKKFFVAAIVTLLVTSVQIAAAEDFDWSKAPRFGTKAELARYIESERRKGNTKIRVILTNGLRITDRADFANISVCINVDGTYYPNNDGAMPIDYEIKEYPGTHVANAYRSGDISGLSAEERQLYNIAVGIVDEANKRPSELEKARYIHDEICRRVLEYRVENDRNKTAIGALIDGYAQCQGFTDAFYMLGRMCGLNVGRIGGTKDNGKILHAWNWITFSDGKSYCVDVTLDDGYNYDKWFLSTYEDMKSNYWCEWSIIPNLQ